MAKSAAAPTSRKERRAAKRAGKPSRGTRLKQLRQAYTVSKKHDPKLPWVMLVAAIVTFAVVELEKWLRFRMPPPPKKP